MTVTVVNGQPQLMTTPVPEELQFKSLDIRARAFTLESDRLYLKDAPPRWIASPGARDVVGHLVDALWEEWHEATGRDDRVAGVFLLSLRTSRRTRRSDRRRPRLCMAVPGSAHGDAVTTGHLYPAAVRGTSGCFPTPPAPRSRGVLLRYERRRRIEHEQRDVVVRLSPMRMSSSGLIVAQQDSSTCARTRRSATRRAEVLSTAGGSGPGGLQPARLVEADAPRRGVAFTRRYGIVAPSGET